MDDGLITDVGIVVQAMRYPLNAHRKELVSVQAALEREKELSREVMRGEHDDDDDALGDL